jgi:serpin B
MRRILPLLPLALLLTACDPPAPPVTASSAQPAPPGPAATSGTPGATTPPADQPRLPPPASGELGALARSNNAFGIDLYAKMRAQKGNLALSPVSLSTALSLTWAGAKGETAAQMKKVLHAEGTPEQALDVAGKLASSLRDPAHKVTVRIANRLFGEKSYTFDPAYLARAKASFGAPLSALDFRKDAEGGRKHINEWVSAETEGRIKDLLPAGALNDQTRLVLTNAVYFKGDWDEPFDKSRTRPEAFHPTPGESKSVPTMHHRAHWGFAATDGVKLLDLPYQGGELSMLVVLPDAGVDAVESRLAPAVLDKWVSALQVVNVDVALPKFEIDPAASTSLADTLKSLGMPLAFERLQADFTGIANPPNPEDRLYISQVFHKAFVKLDEQGTEAAAASAVVMARAGGAAPVGAPPEFHADRPFLFFLRDVKTNMVLFMGRVSDPSVK